MLHMLNFKKLALIATAIWSKTLAETATESKTISQKRVGVKNESYAQIHFSMCVTELCTEIKLMCKEVWPEAVRSL